MIDERYIVAYPPFIIRMLARRPVPGKGRITDPVTDKEISKVSGLSVYRVRFIASRPSWDDVTVGHMRRFLAGCGVKVDKLWRERHFLKRAIGRPGGFSHLEKLPDKERKKIARSYSKNVGVWRAAVLRMAKGGSTPSSVEEEESDQTPLPLP